TEELSTFLDPISSSHTKEELHDSSYNTLYDPDSCYNQWLACLNLPLLPHPQTLSSFLKHIHHYNYLQLNNFNSVLTISIKLDYSKCYIHLLCKSQLLSKYLFSQLSGYTYYLSIPILSKFS